MRRPTSHAIPHIDLRSRLMGFNERFEQALLDTCRAARYSKPALCLHMIEENGGAVAASKTLMTTGDCQADLTKLCKLGLTRLYEIGRLDLSVEAAIIDPAYASLFTNEERAEARKRLDALGYTPNPGS